MRTNNVRHAENLGQVRYLDQICNWPREREKRRKCEGGMAKWQRQRSDSCFALSPSHLRHFSCRIFAFSELRAKVQRSMRVAPTEHHSNSVNILKVYYYKNKFSMILKSSGKNAKRSWGWDSKTKFKHVLTMFRLRHWKQNIVYILWTYLSLKIVVDLDGSIQPTIR